MTSYPLGDQKTFSQNRTLATVETASELSSFKHTGGVARLQPNGKNVDLSVSSYHDPSISAAPTGPLPSKQPSVLRCEGLSPEGGGHMPFAIEAMEILDDVRRALEQDLAQGRAAAARLLRFLTSPTAVEIRVARGGLAPWQMRKIDRYLREHLAHPMRVDKLAGHVCLSVSHFCRAFKESFGDTPHNYIIRLRLGLARQLMLTTNEPLVQIALACGLADQAHLTKLFRRWLNDSPSAWRRRNLTEAQAAARNHQD